MTTNELLSALAVQRGSIVCSADCSYAEIVMAQACGRFYAGAAGYGFVLRPRRANEDELEHDKLKRWQAEVMDVANRVFDLDGCCHWETICEAIEESERERQRQTKLLIRLHREHCTPENCTLDGGKEHADAFSDWTAVDASGANTGGQYP